MAHQDAGDEDVTSSGKTTGLYCGQTNSLQLMEKFQEGLKELWSTQSLSDVTLQADGREFQAHRAVLAAASPFFMAMFSGVWTETRNQKPIELKGVTAVGLQGVLTFIYTGTVALEISNAFEVLMAADHLQVQPAINSCSQYMVENAMPIDNSVDVLNYANMQSLKDLQATARQLVADNFQEVVKRKYHLDLDFDDFLYFLDGSQNGEDAIQFGPEVALFYAVVHWMRHERKRMKHLEQLMKAIRFPLMSAEDVERILYDHPFIMDNPTWQDMTIDLQNYNKKPIHERILDNSKNTVVRSRESVLIMSPSHSNNIEAFTLSSHLQICSDPVESQWKPLKDFPGVDLDLANCQGNVCTVVVNGFLIVLVIETLKDHPPSADSPARLSARVFDPRKFEWSTLPSNNVDHHLKLHTAVVCRDRLCVFMNQENEVARVTVYSFTSNSWIATVGCFSLRSNSVCTYGSMVNIFKMRGGQVRGDQFSSRPICWYSDGTGYIVTDASHDVCLESYLCDDRIVYFGIGQELQLLSDKNRGRYHRYPLYEVSDKEKLPKLTAKGVRVMCGDNLFLLPNKADEPFTSELTLGRKFNKGGNRVIKHQGLPLDLKRGCLAVAIRIPENGLGSQ